MKKSIRKFIFSNITTASLAGYIGGALTLVLALVAMLTKNDALIAGIIGVGALTVVATAVLSFGAAKKVNDAVSAPIEQISKGEEAKEDEETPVELSEAVKAITASNAGKAEASAYIARISEGNFSAEIPEALLSDELGQSFVTLRETINRAFGNLYNGASDVNADGEQISGVSVSLSRGAAEQAGTLQELSSSVSRVKDTVIRNAENAREANRIVAEASAELEEGTAHMKALLTAMDNINKSTEQITEFVKVIEDIAFQTNILALNSSVEAARAGEAGKGFAVVAVEVKNLATRSQEAAQETTAVIEEGGRSVRDGLGKTDKTAQSLSALAEETKEISRLINIISQACDEQSDSIIKIDAGVDQINASVASTNTAAQECVSSAQKLAARSSRLKSEIGSFRFGKVTAPAAPVVKEAPKPVVKEAPKPVAAEAPKPVVKEAPKPVVKEAPKAVVKEAPKAVESAPAEEKPVEEKKVEVKAEVKAEPVKAPAPKPVAAPRTAPRMSAPRTTSVPDSYANAEFVETPDNKY